MTAANLQEFQSTASSSPINGIGVYRVTCLANGMCYTGWSKTVINRLGWHRSHLRNGKHSRRRMVNDFIEHGEGNFSFDVLANFATADEAIAEEAALIAEAFKRGKAYNAVVPVDVTVSFEDRAESVRQREEMKRAREEEEKKRAQEKALVLLKRQLIGEWKNACIVQTRTFQDDDGFRDLIQRFLEVARVSAEEFGAQAAGDAGFVAKHCAVDAPSCTLATAARVRAYIEAFLARFESDPKDFLPILESSAKLVVMDCKRWQGWLAPQMERTAA